ncbi:hypothetical protein [Okeania sp. SIO3I5]|uniref:hypothetical protein n=1 Tax=Okeania sp. SIO3I5 TaxID=2607805 RepID=UPI0025CB86F7|nr:hypothetical protein [Okeania sp. SIO3I5]
MYMQNLKQILIPSNTPKPNQKIFWLILSLTFATIYSLLALKEAFSGEYIVQDDARQHVFWMRRFLDPELFPNDLIADYFQSVAPWGYKTFYWLFSQVGIDPMFLNKLLPLGLTLVTAAYCFGICFQILPIPFAGFIASVLLSQNLWFQDDIASGTPRAFLYPLFLAVLYYLLRKSLVPFLVAIALLGLFYPQYVILTVLILIFRFLDWEKGRFCLSKNREDYIFSGLGLGVSLLVILFYALNSSNYAPVITASQAKILPEFGEAGRSVFFLQNSWDFFILGSRSGILPKKLFLPHILIVGLFLPIVFQKQEGIKKKQEEKTYNLFQNQEVRRKKEAGETDKFPILFQKQEAKSKNQKEGKTYNLPIVFQKQEARKKKEEKKTYNLDNGINFLRQLPLLKQITPKIKLLPQILLAGVTLFVTAHLLLFQLHLPSRYTNHSFRIVLAIATAIVLCITLDGIFHWVSQQPSSKNRRILGLIFIGFLGILLLGDISLWKNFYYPDYQKGQSPEIYEFFAQQPKDILIASLSEEADYIPTFSQRSVLFAWEYAIPYHLGYYSQIKQRATEFIFAQYHSDIQWMENFIHTYGIDFLILERQAFMSEYVLKNLWLRQWYYQMGNQIEMNLQNGNIPAIVDTIDKCSVLETEKLWVLSAKCILNGKHSAISN